MLDRADLVVVGGGLAGCFAALEAAREGMKVVLIEKRSFLGREITANHRAWIGTEGLEFLRKDEQSAIVQEMLYPDWYIAETGEEIPVFIGHMKKLLLQKLLEANIRVLFMSEIAAAEVLGREVTALLLGNKYGLQRLPVKKVMDMTERLNFIRLLQKVPYLQPGSATVQYVVELDNVMISAPESLPPKEELAISRMAVHQAAGGDKRVRVELAFEVDLPSSPYLARSIIENKSRIKAFELITWMRKNDERFKDASPVNLAFEPFVSQQDDFVADCDFDNVFFISSQLKDYFHVHDLLQLKAEAEICAQTAVTSTFDETRIERRGVFQAKNFIIPEEAFTYSTYDDDDIGIFLEKAEIDWSKVQASYLAYDICIAGGGTGGIMAGLAAARNNRNTVLIEAMTDCGGTKTVGYVAGYYQGYRGGRTQESNTEVMAVAEAITGTPQPEHRISRMLSYHWELQESGIDFLLATQVCDTLAEGKKVKGCAAVNEDGIFLVKSVVTVDTTGDGDVACFAGVPYQYGDPRDGVQQCYSQWGLEAKHLSDHKQRYYMNSLEPIAAERYSELLRGLYQAAVNNSDYDFAVLLTVRESRRICGEYQLKLIDGYEATIFDDCIAVALTSVDSHGRVSSNYARLGYMENRENEPIPMRIPYRCCIPAGYEGILVAAKSISATRDAASLCRMSADIQNLGHAIGLAASLAVSTGKGVRDIPLQQLQDTLIQQGVLPQWAFVNERKISTLQERVDRLKSGDDQALFEVIRMPEATACPYLEEEFHKSGASDKLEIAKAMAWYGSSLGADLIVAEFRRLSSSEQLDPKLVRTSPDGLIDRGIVEAIDQYWSINQLLVLMGLSENFDGLDDICRLVLHTEAGGAPIVPETPYYQSRVDHRIVPFYERIINICFCLERLADPQAIPALEALLVRNHIGGYWTPKGSVRSSNFFCAYLEVCVARTLARCGGKRGAERLVNYLNDSRYPLRSHTLHELRDISGQDYGYDQKKWLEWIESAGTKDKEFRL